MTQEKSLQVLVQVALLAQSKGVLSLDDAVLVREAINVFAQDKAQKEQVETDTQSEEVITEE